MPDNGEGRGVSSYDEQRGTGSGVTAQMRAALIVRVRVLGRLHFALSVARPVHQGDEIEVAVSNRGNVLVELSGHVLGTGTAHGLALTPKGLYVEPVA